jgi:HTH-type transcriptional regulator/antitoxin HigA
MIRRSPQSEPDQAVSRSDQYLLEEAGLRQEDLADGAPPHHIAAMLSGKRAISKESARKLARRVGVHVDVFLSI